MSKPVVFVIGATGQVGTATLTSLSAKYADQVEIRAGVRNPDKAEKLKAIPNMTVVQATMGDSNLVGVFIGVSTLFVVTPGANNRVQLVTTTAECAKQAGVKHIVFIGGNGSDSIFGRELTELENIVAKVGVPHTVVSLAMFMENYFSFKDSIVGQGTIYNPVDPDKPFASVAVDDIGNALAAILVDPEKHANQKINITSDCHTYNDLVKALSEALGKEIKYVRVSYEEARKTYLSIGLQEWQVDGVLDLFKSIDASSPPVTKYDLGLYKRLTGEEPTDVKKWVAKYAAGFQ